MTVLQKAVGMVLSARMPGRQTADPHRERSLSTSVDPFIEDMLRTRIADRHHATIYLFSAIADGRRHVVWEEWRLASHVHQKPLDPRIVLRSIAVIAGALPPLPEHCHFGIDECPPTAIPIDQCMDNSDDNLVEPFSVIQVAGEGGSVLFRRDAEHDRTPDTPGAGPSATLIHETNGGGPDSFASVKLQPAGQLDDHDDHDVHNDHNDHNDHDDDTAELTAFLKRLESRPALPGLYSDSWLADFGEGGWEAVVKEYDSLHASTASNDAPHGLCT